MSQRSPKPYLFGFWKTETYLQPITRQNQQYNASDLSINQNSVFELVSFKLSEETKAIWQHTM